MEMDGGGKESNSRGNNTQGGRTEEKAALWFPLFFCGGGVESEMLLLRWPRLIPVSAQTAPRGPSRQSL